MKTSVSALILYTENTYKHTNLYDIVSQKTGNLHQYYCENVIVHSTSVGCLLCVKFANSSAFKSRKPSCWETCVPVGTAAYPRRRYLRQYFCHRLKSRVLVDLCGETVAFADLKAFKNVCEVVKTEVVFIMY